MSTRKGQGRWPLPKGWRFVEEFRESHYVHESGARVEYALSGWDCWPPGISTGAGPDRARTRAEAFRKAVGK